METITLAGLDVRLRGSVGSTGPKALVILLHGYGAPGNDLVSLANEIAVPASTQFLFPAAPIDLAADDPNLGDARAWWPIDVLKIQISVMSGSIQSLGTHLRPGMAAAVNQISNLVLGASQHFGVPMERIVLGGFSQGAIVCLEAALEQGWNLAGLLIFSGTCLDRQSVYERALKVAPMNCVVSHGQMDPILPFQLAEDLRDELKRAGWSVDWVPFLGGHGIPPQATVAAGRMVSRQLA